MRPLISDMPNGRELIDELDLATVQMMSIPVELVGGDQWQGAFNRQQQAFWKWREYLLCMADGRPSAGTLRVTRTFDLSAAASRILR